MKSDNNIRNVSYWFFPDGYPTGKHYNSNSFVNGLLKAAAITTKRPKSSVPGWESYLPAYMFGV